MLPRRSASRLMFMGRPLDAVTMDDTVALCAEWINDPRRRSHVVMTVNAATLMAMRRNPVLARACAEADLVLADGAAVVWAGRLAGLAIPERVTGIDLMDRLVRAADEQHWRIFLFGARPDIVQRLARLIGRRMPGADVVGSRNGYFEPRESRAIADQVRAARPDVLFLGMPTPLKELWAWQNRDMLETPVILGVGGSFDVLAGRTPRAPLVVQRMGLEWAWRLAMEPRRLWRRYLVTNTEFLASAAVEVVRRRRTSRSRGGQA